MAISARKDGGPNTKYYESSDTLTQFETVKSWLLKNCRKHVAADPPTAKSLSQLTVQLLQFMEDTCGSKAAQPPQVRLPNKCFLDFKAGGGLCVIFNTLYKYKSEHSWRRFDFQSPSRKDANLELLKGVSAALVAAGCWSVPKVAIHGSVDPDMKRGLADIVTRHQGTVVENEADATHIVFDEKGFLDDEFARAVLRRDRLTLFHFYSFPDSHDSWCSNVELEYDLPQAYAQEEFPYKVCANWLTDLASNNEWMNEADYACDQTGAKLKHPHCLSVEDTMALGEPSEDRKEKSKKDKSSKESSKKRPRSPPSPRGSSRRKTGRSSSSAPAPSPKPAKKQKTEEEEDLTATMEDPPAEPVVTEVGRVATPKGGPCLDLDNQEAAEVKPEPGTLSEPEDTATDQTHHIVVPSYSAWFDYNAIHAIEKRGLPEFFNSKNKSKTPEIYLAYRNFMIDTYRLNPSEYLTSTACRRNLAGDICAIMRVHAFLEQWGLLNYQVDTDARPTPMGPPPTAHFHVLADAPSGLASVGPQRVAQPCAARVCDLSKTEEAASAGSPGPVAPGTELGLRLDQYGKRAQKKAPGATQTRDWTERETVLLLEAIEMYKDDWNKVCEHVGSRTQDECILHFLRLPIEDPYLEDCGPPLSGPLQAQPIAFSKSGNPIMSTVAFLASVVDPRIAASAAQAAMGEFCRIKEEVPAGLLDTHVGTVATHAANTGKVDGSVGMAKTGVAGAAGEGEEEEKKEVKEEEKDKEEKEKEEDGTKKEAKEEGASAESEEDQARIAAVEKLRKDASVQQAASAALGAAAVKAKHLAAVEERKIKSLVALLVETQMKKLEIKLRHFEELETIMDRERESLEVQRQQLLQEQQQFHLEQLKAAELRARQHALQQQLQQQQQQQGMQQQPMQH